MQKIDFTRVPFLLRKISPQSLVPLVSHSASVGITTVIAQVVSVAPTYYIKISVKSLCRVVHPPGGAVFCIANPGRVGLASRIAEVVRHLLKRAHTEAVHCSAPNT